jgi:RNA-directed DNA polymerase
MYGVEQEVLIKKLNPILRGFANYYKGVVAKKPLAMSLTEYGNTFGALAKRRHPNKNTSWVRKRYFKTINFNKWTFATTISVRRGKEKDLILYPIASTPIERHVKVKGEASSDDPSRARILGETPPKTR